MRKAQRGQSEVLSGRESPLASPSEPREVRRGQDMMSDPSRRLPVSPLRQNPRHDITASDASPMREGQERQLSIPIPQGESAASQWNGDSSYGSGLYQHRRASPKVTHATVPNNRASIEFASPDSGITEGSSSSYREVTWKAMFDHFLDGRRNEEEVLDKCSITYLGESFPLSIVLKDYRGGGKQKLHYPGVPCPESESTEKISNHNHPNHMLSEDITALEAKGAFESPAPDILDALISTFLERVFPIYPIVNRQEFNQQYKANRIPWILLHALCFIAATFCPVSILHRAGFTARREARFSYYTKAKALFDNGYELNKLVVLQSVILLAFWGGGPNNHWNFYSWISTGVTIAETLGMHRSMATANIKPQDRSLLKRLWWILVIRDASCSALVGRPFRINLDQCDMDSLTLEDFRHQSGCENSTLDPESHISGLYQIQISRLSLILREIVTARFYPGRTAATTGNLQEMLVSWRAQLPLELEWTDNASSLNIFSSCLSILYNHHLILSHLNRTTDVSPRGDATGTGISRKASDEISHTAAQRISTLACKIVTKSDVLLMPHELFHGIFLAEVVFYTQMKSPQSMIAQLGRSSLANCQMVLHESRESWDPSPWIMQLFDNLSRGAAEGVHDEIDLLPGAADITGAVPNVLDATGLTSGYDLWQSNSMLATLFEMPLESGMQMAIPDGTMYEEWFDNLAAPGTL